MKGYDVYDGQAKLDGGDSSAVLAHLSLVHKTAAHIKARLPDHVELEELVQIGMLGLLEATRKFDPAMGVELSTFASKRIRGAIIDEVRKRSPLSRADSSYLESQGDAVTRLSNELGRAPSAAEIANKMNSSVSDYEKQRSKAQSKIVTSLDSEQAGADSSFVEHYGPENALEDTETLDWLSQKVSDLPQREQLILSLYYTDEMNLREIGAILEISESRVSQILTKTVEVLRKKLIT
jgi:RNA polymerase sigma factor for flagellar operon FliA